ncbi:hypothetical protein ABL78_4688 [Leptomonas seymouri]|uniref:Uncharacterized protein n=1 Tax=Leptomonas seymouri TaxID=5684 RepID=A0A0N1PBP5_LEPSE|nr:hypothetical protein ABL78_4688 [Leptomonas seymouri]|eukprot:KPI86262.1 hypothetical protein ABL78_4688 [Leptomonas seymouri]
MEDTVGSPVAADSVMPVLPERGLVFSEVKYMQLQLCKPKLLPIKSHSLQKLEKMEKKLAQEAKEKRDADRALRHSSVGWTSPDLRKEPHSAAPVAAVAGPRAASPLSAPLSPPSTEPAKAPVATPTRASETPTSTPHSSKQDGSMSGMQLTEEELDADAPMSPQEHTFSGDSVSSGSSSEYR